MKKSSIAILAAFSIVAALNGNLLPTREMPKATIQLWLYEQLPRIDQDKPARTRKRGKLGFLVSIDELAKLDKVSVPVEKVSQYYNINIPQYGYILSFAEQRGVKVRDPRLLDLVVNVVYEKRFGLGWRNRMKTLFDTYSEKASSLVRRGSFSEDIGAEERHFVRMVELGAAMASLYYGTQPNRKNAVDSAIKLYKELGYLH